MLWCAGHRLTAKDSSTEGITHLLNTLLPRYLTGIDSTLHQILDRTVTEHTLSLEFSTMLRYPLGWVDEQNQPYDGQSGKRIRPTLLLMCCDASGGNWEQALPAAAAVELLHNFSLIHDDIEDNSPTRHGRATVWKIWGSNQGINTGDAMFAVSYRALAQLTETGVPDWVVLRCWQILNHMTLELTRGQHLDMAFEKRETISVEDYLSMIRGKTAALVAGSAQLGAMIGSGDEELSQHYADFGLNLGLAFQLHDDILGIWGNPEVTGKSAATDIRDRKKSLPILYGLEHSPTLRDLYQSSDSSQTAIDQIITELDAVGAREETERRELVYYEQATSALEAASPQGDAAEGLQALKTRLLKRVS
jgi:geranylgeranyl diphosphate synthase type I